MDREPSSRRKDAPGPVKKGGWWLKVYSISVSLAFVFLFLASFIAHLYGSLKDYNLKQLEKGDPPVAVIDYLWRNRFWFESFQNWQSELLSVASIILLTIFLRQKGSPQPKPVDSPDSENE